MKIKTKILGLSYIGNHHTVVLEDLTNNKIKLPIIITDDAAIEIAAISSESGDASLIEKFIRASEVDVKEIYINELNTGVFNVKVTLDTDNSFMSSVSESLIMAYSSKCEIYVSDEIMKSSGVKLNDDETVDYTEIEYGDEEGETELTTLDELKLDLEIAIEEENYESAAELQKKINKRENNTK